MSVRFVSARTIYTLISDKRVKLEKKISHCIYYGTSNNNYVIVIYPIGRRRVWVSRVDNIPSASRSGHSCSSSVCQQCSICLSSARSVSVNPSSRCPVVRSSRRPGCAQANRTWNNVRVILEVLPYACPPPSRIEFCRPGNGV